jgi:hypothetical protein
VWLTGSEAEATILVVAPTIGTTIQRGIAIADEHTQPSKQQKGPQPMRPEATIEDPGHHRVEADHVQC